MKDGPMSMIRSFLPPGKTAGDLAKERNKLEVSRRIDQVPAAKKLDEEELIRFTTNIVDASRSLELSRYLEHLETTRRDISSCGF